ncbi:hypothetical protein RsoM2USA_429 [Ralstonia phage RsoM2USA]|nr:hypothetical protein RsoM2USA_429 [Ralstonia phage RsoM2USA]
MAKATLTYNAATDKWEAKYNGVVIIKGGSRQYVENAVNSGLNTKCKKLGIDGFLSDEVAHEDIRDSISEMFGVTERFEMLNTLATMIANDKAKSLIVTGTGGLGKTHMILEAMRAAGLQSADEAPKFDATVLFPKECEELRKAVHAAIDKANAFYAERREELEEENEDNPDFEHKLAEIDLEYPNIEFNNLDHGKILGTAHYASNTISFNFAAYLHNPSAFINVVAPHEVSHLVVDALYADADKHPKAHGKEFRKVMQECFDLDGSATTPVGDMSYVHTNETWKNPGDYTMIKGYSTAKGLYKALYANRNKIVILDDCDSVWKDAVSLNIMKAALDSYDKRIVSWNADIDDMPTSFEFTGRMIFISNLSQNDLSQAVKSRSLRVDLSMTTLEKIERMEHLVESEEFMAEVPKNIKREAMAFMKEHAAQATDLNIRTLMSVITLRMGAPKSWTRLALYTITA